MTDKATIEPTKDYTPSKSASGSQSRHTGDTVATGLAGLTLDEVYALAAELLEVDVKELREKYDHLNDGMQRMNLGNRMRGEIGKINRQCDKDKAAKKPVGPSGESIFEEFVAPYHEARDEREAAAAAAKEEQKELPLDEKES